MTTSVGLSTTATIKAAQALVASDLGGETVILSLRDGMYYGLDEVGARVWGLIQEPRSVADVRDTLLSEYDVEPAACEQDLLALLNDLAAAGLVEVQDVANS